MPKFQKGDPKPANSGRRKGQPNKTTTKLREAVLQALDDAGGAKYLEDLARNHPQAFTSLLSKILPTQIEGDGPGVVVRIVRDYARGTPPEEASEDEKQLH